MGVTEGAYLVFLAGAGLVRLVEVEVSRRNQQRLVARGAKLVPEPCFPAMVAVHAGVLAGSAIEVAALRRPWIPELGYSMAILFLMANALRWWVVRTMGGRWSVRVLTPSRLGVVTGGPFRWVRHPNYLAVMVELAAIPLIHTAWMTAVLGSVANGLVLRKRVAVEESVLMRDSRYRAEMGPKPRFLPRLGKRGGR